MVHRGTAANNSLEMSQYLGTMLGLLNLVTTNKHEVYSTSVIPVFESRLPVMLTVNSNQIQVTNHGLKVLFVTMGCLTILGVT